MGAKAILRNSAASAVELARVNRCYMIADSGEEVKVTKEMIQMACHQILSRCKK